MPGNQPPQKGHPSLMRRIGRIFIFILIGILSLFLVLVLLVQTPQVQNIARNKIESFLEKKLNTRVDIGKLRISIPDVLVLENVYIEDQQKDTLLYGGKLKVDLSTFKLLNNEVEINDLALENFTANVKRVLPDTVFNFQFIIDAFLAEQKKPATADTAAMKMAVKNLVLDKIRLVFNDVITGSDMNIWLEHFETKIARLDPVNLQFDVPVTRINGLSGTLYQHKPLVTVVEPVSKDMAEAAKPIPFQLNFKEIELTKINFKYSNHVSAVYTDVNLGELLVNAETFNLQQRTLALNNLHLNNTTTQIRFGKKQASKAVAKEVSQEVLAEAQNAWRIVVKDVEINNNNFQFDNDNLPRQPHGMDYAHLNAKNLTLHADNFLLSHDTISGAVTKAELKERDFVLTRLETNFLYSTREAYLHNLVLQTPGTSLTRSAAIYYGTLQTFQKNIGQLQVDVDIDNSKVQVKDILTFAPQLRHQVAFANPNKIWTIDGRIRGTIARLQIDNLYFNGLQNTNANLRGTINGLPDVNKFSGNLVINNLSTTRNDLLLFVPKNAIPNTITLPERFAINGTIAGDMANVTTKLNLNTNLGNASVNGTFKNLTSPTNIQYNASIKTTNLNIGTIIQNPEMVGSITSTFTANGKGFDPKTANAKISGVVHSALINNYNYRNVQVDGAIARQQVNALLNINDPNIDLSLNAKTDLSKEFPSVVLTAEVDSIKTLPLNFTTEPVIFRGNITGNFPVTDPANLQGELLITKSLLVTNDFRIPLDTIQVKAGRSDSGNYVHVNSEAINAQLYGQYNLAQLGSVFIQTIQPYFALVPNYKVVPVAPYNFTITASVINKPFLKVLLPDLQALEPLNINAHFSNTTGLQATVYTPLLIYAGTRFDNLNLTARTEQEAINILTTLQKIGSPGVNMYATTLGASIANNKIDFRLNIKDKSAKNKYQMAGLFQQAGEQKYALSLKPDSLLLNYDAWTVANGNAINFSQTGINFNNFILSKNNQRLSINSISDAYNSPVDVGFENFQIRTITAFMQSDTLLADGTINGKITLNNLLAQPTFVGDLTIANLSVKNDTVGNVKMYVNNPSLNTYKANVTITGRGNDIQLAGNYFAKGTDGSFDMVLNIRQLQLNTVDAFTLGAVREATGSVNGNFVVNGTLKKPVVQGDLNFNKVGLNVAMLNSYFSIDKEKISVNSNDGIAFNTFTIKDSLNNSIVIDGNAYTKNFFDYNFDLTIKADDFRAINTTKRDNKLFYGQLFFDTELKVAGTSTNPVVDGSIVIGNNTIFTVVLPQAEPGIVEREGIVRFVDMDNLQNDSLFLANAYDSLNTSAIIGMDVAVNIEITKEAEFNLIIDEGNGDFLRVKGEALLTAGIDPSGKINMTGSYVFDEGSYELSFNFLRRRFTIEKGSSVIWKGEPTNAEVNVTAIYVSNTSPLPLVESQLGDAPVQIRNTYRQALPFEVHLKVTGDMMLPDIAFNVVLPDKNYNVSNDIVTAVDTRLEQLRNEPSEMNKQVFALLLLNRFVSDNPFAGSGGGGGVLNAERFARQSVSKLLTEQLNKLAKDLIGGVEINFDVVSPEDYTTGELRYRTDLTVGVSKQLLSNRLKVTVGSNFELEGPSGGAKKTNNLAGDIAIDYLLSKDGKYLLRAYRRNEYEGEVEGYILESGLRFIITLDYNHFRELFRKKKKTEDKKQTETIDENKKTTTPGGN